MTLKLNGTNSVAAPAYAGDDADTGLQCGTDELKLVTGGSARATVDSSGRLGVGTASPTSLIHGQVSSGSAIATLESTATSGEASVSIKGKNSSGTARTGIFKYDSADRFRIGTTAGIPIAFETNDTERLRVDGGGRFFFNENSSDLSHKYIFSGNETSDVAAFQYNSNSGTYLAISTGAANGNVEIKADARSGNFPPLTFKTGANERMRMTKDGCLVINGTSVVTRSQTVNFQIGEGNNSFGIQRANSVNVIEVVSEVGTTAARNQFIFKNPNGTVGRIATSGTATGYNTTSDYRVKENIVDLDGAIARVKQLQPRRFNFIADNTTTVDGFVAHEAQAVVPEAVTGTHNEVDDDGNAVMQGIDQSKLVPLLTAALQEAIAKIETLETKVTALETAGS